MAVAASSPPSSSRFSFISQSQRKLGHSSQAISESTWCRGRTEFSDVNKMNLGAEAFGELSRQIDHRRCYIGKIDRNKNSFHVRAFELSYRGRQPQDSK